MENNKFINKQENNFMNLIIQILNEKIVFFKMINLLKYY